MDVAYNLIEEAMKKAAMDPITGNKNLLFKGLIDMDVLTTGRSKQSRENV